MREGVQTGTSRLAMHKVGQCAHFFYVENLGKRFIRIFRTITTLTTPMHRSRRPPLPIKAAMMSPKSSLMSRDEHVKQSRGVSWVFPNTEEQAPKPAGHRSKNKKVGKQRKNREKVGKQRYHSIGSRRFQFCRLDSSESINALVPVSEENQTGENGGGSRTIQVLEMDHFLEYNIELDNLGQRSKSVKKSGPYNPSPLRTTTIRIDPNNNLQVAAPLRTAPPTEKGDHPKKRHSKKTHAVFPQLRFEDGSADVHYVTMPFVSSAERKNTSKKKSHAAVVLPQLQILASSRVTTLDDLDVQQYVRRAPRRSSMA